LIDWYVTLHHDRKEKNPMQCIICNEAVPQNWYEHHCIPVVKIDGRWVDMYNHLGELQLPIEHVAHWLCYTQDSIHTSAAAASSPSTRTT
jgi:hypothetical protein